MGICCCGMVGDCCCGMVGDLLLWDGWGFIAVGWGFVAVGECLILGMGMLMLTSDADV